MRFGGHSSESNLISSSFRFCPLVSGSEIIGSETVFCLFQLPSGMVSMSLSILSQSSSSFLFLPLVFGIPSSWSITVPNTVSLSKLLLAFSNSLNVSRLSCFCQHSFSNVFSPTLVADRCFAKAPSPPNCFKNMLVFSSFASLTSSRRKMAPFL